MIVLNDMIEGRKNNFDFIRFIAAIMVMYSHAWPLSGTICDNKFFPKGYDLGAIAVMLFFIISGFLISQSFDRCKTKYDYIKSRSLRIFPGLVVAIFILTFVVGPVCTTLSLKEYFSSTDTYLYLLNSIWCIRWTLPGVFESNSFPSVNGSIWTIPLEIICYILVLVIGRNYLRKNIFIVTSLILVILKENKIFNDTSLLGLSIYSIINMVFMFSVGMWIYCQRNIIVLNMKFAIATFFCWFMYYIVYQIT